MGILTASQIAEMGFAFVGEGARLSDKTSYYGCSRIWIGANTRIDDFGVISAGEGGIFIGEHVHIAVYAAFIGAGKISVGDYAGISGRASIYSSNDDYSGAFMTNPTMPSEFCNVHNAEVAIGRHAIVGAGSIVLPGVCIEEGAIIGALSLVKYSCSAFKMYAGIPAKYIAERDKGLLDKEQQFLAEKKAALG